MGKFGEIDSADMRAEKFPLVPMGGWEEGPACADTGARAPLGASGIFLKSFKQFCKTDRHTVKQGLLLKFIQNL